MTEIYYLPSPELIRVMSRPNLSEGCSPYILLTEEPPRQEGDSRTVNQSLSSHMVSQWSGSTYNHTIVMLSGFIEDLKTIKNLYEQLDL